VISKQETISLAGPVGDGLSPLSTSETRIVTANALLAARSSSAHRSASLPSEGSPLTIAVILIGTTYEVDHSNLASPRG